MDTCESTHTWSTMLVIMSKAITDQPTSLGTLPSGQALTITPSERIGNLYILGRAGTGKSVILENIVISDLVAARGGMLIDPYGDLIETVQQYVPIQHKTNVITFNVVKGSAEQNIKRFNQQMDWSAVKNNPQAFLLCNLSYFIIGSHTARTIGLHILKMFYTKLGKTQHSANRSLFIDEAYNFMDESILKQITTSKAYKLRTILLDQSLNNYSNDHVNQLLASSDKLLCFNVNTRTAKIVTDKFKIALSPTEIVNIEQYHFYAKLGKTKPVVKVKGVFPLSYPKV